MGHTFPIIDISRYLLNRVSAYCCYINSSPYRKSLHIKEYSMRDCFVGALFGHLDADITYRKGEGFKNQKTMASKVRICCECGAKIERREKYYRIKSTCDTKETFRMCEFCKGASNVIGEWPFGELWYNIVCQGKENEILK